ncbi:AAA family ATPase [uncultured Paracoccus sp.]|uniref:ATP-dependent nuclease n=1 Tax=uncultured Paracoccus sp. TaxID=189685 RepID=UPI002595CA51|nr:AAA family ATPase [uncultured Paracoccus sp.]
MAQIRLLEIKNFRSIKDLAWQPAAGINCLIGPGDSGKSTILDAIDLCLGARRTVQFTDADFSELNVQSPIEITITLGDLSDQLKTLDIYGLFLRGFNADTKQLEDEPGAGLETVMCLQLRVSADLEPVWSLVSDRAAALGIERGLAWADRQEIAPSRIGSYSDLNLSWKRGSVLNRLSDEKPDASAILLEAARTARQQFGASTKGQLADALTTVKEVADELGIGGGAEFRAELEAHSVSMSAGTISLHDDTGVPVRGMGIGSTRLLIAGLQKEAAAGTSIVVVDEVEHGLEPHRIIRFLGALGAKDTVPSLQVFMTSHSPVVVRELDVAQLTIVRKTGQGHSLKWVGDHQELQGTLRLFPEALLARSVLVCEGASEVGFVRGIDQWCSDNGKPSLHASGTSLVDGRGDEMLKRAQAFLDLGYRTALLRDDDKRPDPAKECSFEFDGGQVFRWRDGKKIEVEIFDSVPQTAIQPLLDLALEMFERQALDNQLKSASGNAVTTTTIAAELSTGTLSKCARSALGVASGKKSGWFKNISIMEGIGRDIIAPRFAELDEEFKKVIKSVRKWTINA